MEGLRHVLGLLGNVLLKKVTVTQMLILGPRKNQVCGKIREIEKPVEDTCQEAKRKMLPNSSYQMCSDGFDEESQRGYWRPKSEIPGTQEDDFLRQNPAGVAHVNHCSVSLVHFSLKASGVVSLHCVSAERHSFPFP